MVITKTMDEREIRENIALFFRSLDMDNLNEQDKKSIEYIVSAIANLKNRMHDANSLQQVERCKKEISEMVSLLTALAISKVTKNLLSVKPAIESGARTFEKLILES
jgi:uncharacterized protein YaaR (DUF327 family)